MARFDCHIASASIPYLGLAVFQGWEATPAAIGFSILGSVFSDIDTERSIIGDLLPVAKLCKKAGIEIEHQGFLHSLPFIGIAGLIASPLLLSDWKDAYIAFLLALLGHQVLDGIISDPPAQGIKWLAPISDARYVFCPNPEFSFEYGSKQEAVLRWVMLAVTGVLLAINLITPRLILNWHFSDTEAAIELIDLWGSQHTLKATLKAKDMLTNQTVEGVYEVEGVKDNLVILRQGRGLISLGDGYDTKAALRAEHIRVHKDKPVRVESYEINLAGQSLQSISHYVEAGRDYRLFSKLLVLKEPAALPISARSFSPVEIAGKSLLLHLATLEDLEPIKDVVVEEGIVAVRYKLAPGENILMADPSSSRFLEFEIGEQADIQVVIGQLTSNGNVIAILFRHRQEMALKEQKKSSLLQELQSIPPNHIEHLRYFELERKALLSQLQHEKKEEMADSLLNKKGFASELEVDAQRVDVKALQAKLQKLEADEANEKAFTETRMRNLQLEIAQVENDLIQLEKRAYIRSPYTGIIKDISFAQSKDKVTVRLELQPLQGSDVRK